MKAQVNNCLYSGMCHLDPWLELNEETSQELYDMIFSSRLESKTRFPQGLGALGPESFIITFFDKEDSLPVNVSSKPGLINICRWSVDKDLVSRFGEFGHTVIMDRVFEDTVGLNEYLVKMFASIVEAE